MSYIPYWKNKFEAQIKQLKQEIDLISNQHVHSFHYLMNSIFLNQKRVSKIESKSRNNFKIGFAKQPAFKNFYTKSRYNYSQSRNRNDFYCRKDETPITNWRLENRNLNNDEIVKPHFQDSVKLNQSNFIAHSEPNVSKELLEKIEVNQFEQLPFVNVDQESLQDALPTENEKPSKIDFTKPFLAEGTDLRHNFRKIKEQRIKLITKIPQVKSKERAEQLLRRMDKLRAKAGLLETGGHYQYNLQKKSIIKKLENDIHTLKEKIFFKFDFEKFKSPRDAVKPNQSEQISTIQLGQNSKQKVILNKDETNDNIAVRENSEAVVHSQITVLKAEFDKIKIRARALRHKIKVTEDSLSKTCNLLHKFDVLFEKTEKLEIKNYKQAEKQKESLKRNILSEIDKLQEHIIFLRQVEHTQLWIKIAQLNSEYEIDQKDKETSKIEIDQPPEIEMNEYIQKDANVDESIPNKQTNPSNLNETGFVKFLSQPPEPSETDQKEIIPSQLEPEIMSVDESKSERKILKAKRQKLKTSTQTLDEELVQSLEIESNSENKKKEEKRKLQNSFF